METRIWIPGSTEHKPWIRTLQGTIKPNRKLLIHNVYYWSVLTKCHKVLRGSKKYGGCQMMEIYTKQLILHLEILQQHICRNDGARKAIICNLNSQTVQIGSSKSFYILDPSEYCCREQRNKPMYLWKTTYKQNISMHIPEVKKYKHEVCTRHSITTTTIL